MGMSATQLASTFGREAAAMNVLLRDQGFLKVGLGAWRPTELGKQFVKSHDFDNGYGLRRQDRMCEPTPPAIVCP